MRIKWYVDYIRKLLPAGKVSWTSCGPTVCRYKRQFTAVPSRNITSNQPMNTISSDLTRIKKTM